MALKKEKKNSHAFWGMNYMPQQDFFWILKKNNCYAILKIFHIYSSKYFIAFDLSHFHQKFISISENIIANKYNLRKSIFLQSNLL